MSKVSPIIEDSWKKELKDEFNSTYFEQLKEFLVDEKSKFTIYPPGSQIFAAFNFTPFNHVKVVILGQDPYHGPGQAHGLCFSVPEGVKQPPSLQNIFKEIHADLGYEIPKHGNLQKWAKQGVLLLNASLTVRARQAGSHQKRGWETFTDVAIKKLSEMRQNLVFLLWGNFAMAKESLIDSSKHFVLKSAHPSPFSVHRGFFGNKHFSQTNKYLKEHGFEDIDWRV